MSSDAMQLLADNKVVDSKVQDVADRYTVGDMLGEGRFSQVFSATRGKQSVALKAVDMGTLEEDEEAVEALVQEVTALRRAYAASKGHVPKVHEVLQTADTVYVVMDQVRGCELFEMLEQGPLSESSARRLIAQLLSALASLHKHHVVHRDVKPENLMVTDVDDPNKCRLVMVRCSLHSLALARPCARTARVRRFPAAEEPSCCLSLSLSPCAHSHTSHTWFTCIAQIDFGYAAIGSSSNERLEGLAGSPEYAAPEVLSWLDGDGEPYDRSCDMWSVGVTAYVLLCGELPYDFPDESNLAEHVRTAPIKFTQPCWTQPALEGGEGAAEMLLAQDFVKACMRVDPGSRLSAKQALQHGWFAPRADDNQSVAIGASKAAMAALERRVASLTVTDAPKRVIRWFGRLAGRKRAASPTKQLFWELKMGMPAGIAAQEQEGKAAPAAVESTLGAAASSAGTSSDAQGAKVAPEKPSAGLPPSSAFQLQLPPSSPLVMRPLASVNAPALEFLHSARKAIALDSDRAEEAAIKRGSTPRLSGRIATGVENPLPSPRRALFLAPSPRSSVELEGAMTRPASRPSSPPDDIAMGA